MEVEGQRSAQDYEAKKLEFQKEMMEFNRQAPVATSLIDRQTSAVR
jgi:hypothetical protein